MGIPTPPLPARRPELVLKPVGDNGQSVVKDSVNGAYYNLQAQESFLLWRLDGRQRAADICSDFERQFGEALSEEELHGFVDLAQSMGLLQSANGHRTSAPDEVLVAEPEHVPEQQAFSAPKQSTPARKPRQSILYWRKRVFDPDGLFNWLEPKIRFIWTPGFLALSLACIVVGCVLVVSNRHDLAKFLPKTLRWETLALAWLALFVATTCHEFAHGLTCKHYGGEVHEVGFLLLFFMPCFYCNVSDAWLIPQKSRRLWVTLAGGYCDLVMWALATMVWRVTQPQTLVCYLAWVVLTVCGGRIFFNFNPLLKLDGYYLLSDWAEIPNLRQRSWSYVSSRVRWLLWGGPRPARDARGRFLLVYGMISWLFSLTYLTLMLVALVQFLGARWGVPGVVAVCVLAFVTVPGLFQGFVRGELRNMIWQRRKRTVVWLGGIAWVSALLYFGEMDDRASGIFQVRPSVHAEIRAPVSGFLRQVNVDEGDRVEPSRILARMEIPDLVSRKKEKLAEIQEVKAKLHLLELGPRAEEVEQQRRRLDRARAWRDLAQQDLERARRALHEDLDRLTKQISQYQAEVGYARYAYLRDDKLHAEGTLPDEQFRERKRNYEVSVAQLEQAQAQKRAREAMGTQEMEAELGRREKDVAEAKAALTLLEAGTRREEIDAERAHLARLMEEQRYLETLEQKVDVRSPVPGLITTPRLRESCGHYLKEGDLICTVEDPSQFEADIQLEEQEVSRVRIGQDVVLKVRALPFQPISARVTRLGASAQKGDVQSSVTVYCQLREHPEELRSGMTGFARICCGHRCLGTIVGERLLRFFRTEFWW